MFNFKKNNNVEDVVVTKELLKDKEVLIYHTLQGLCENGRVYEDHYVNNHVMGDIVIEAKILKYEAGVIQIGFELDHKYLLEPISELISAFDKSLEDSIITGAKKYYDRVLKVFIVAIQSQSKIKIHSSLNERHVYDLFRSKISYVGKKKSDFDDLLPLLKEELAQFVGNKRMYYIKVSIAYSNQELTCNVFIDGKLSHCLSSIVLDKIDVKKTRKDWVEKQYFYLIQDVWSHDPYPFSIQQIQGYTQKAIRLLQKCFHKHDVETVYDIIERNCCDPSLTNEIVGLIPELFCKYYYPNIPFDDRIILYKDNGGKRTIYTSSMYTYNIIEACVNDYLKKNKLGKDKIVNVLRYSPNAQVISALIKEKSDLSEFRIQGISLTIRGHYVLK